MKVTATDEPIIGNNSDAVVIAASTDQPLSSSAQEVDRACNGKLTELIQNEHVSTEKLSVTSLPGLDGIEAGVLVIVGLGKENEPGLGFQAAAAAAKHLAKSERQRVAFYFDEQASSEAIAGSMVGCVGQDLYRNEKSIHPFDEIGWAGVTDEFIRNGEILGRSINLTRDLVNEPANQIYPESFADKCQEVGKSSGFEVEVWDEKKLSEEKCGSMLAVARASVKPPRLVIMRYRGGSDDSIPLTLVGKGVTFDSGGLSLKPSEFMLDMKCDMAGAATVVGAMQAIAQLKLPINVNGLVGLAENMISGDAFRLGDVLVARSGKTIEVHNTDAEGRLVLADVLNVAVGEGTERIIDLATLTGACMVALGKYVAGIMTNDQSWCDDVLLSAKETGEPAWQLPMFERFQKDIKSEVADIKNVGDGRWGGAITAAKFLEEFVEETPWVHIDIAGPSFLDKPQPWIDAGASGCFVQTLVRAAEKLSK